MDMSCTGGLERTLRALAPYAAVAFAGVLVQLFLFNKAAATKTRPKDPEADTARLIAA